MTDEQRAELKRLADAATPGPWFVGYWGGRCRLDHRHGTPACQYDYSKSETYSSEGTSIAASEVGRVVVRSGYDGAEIDEADARYIAAANPAAVLDLLAENERLREALHATRGALVALHNGVRGTAAGEWQELHVYLRAAPLAVQMADAALKEKP